MNIAETVIFKIKPNKIDQAKSVRPSSLEYIRKNYPGVISIEALHAADDQFVFMDLCKWETLELAKSAAEKAMSDPNLTPYFETIESVVFMGHFATEGDQK